MFWLCLDCGHNFQSDQPPANCPICSAGRERFEQADGAGVDDAESMTRRRFFQTACLAAGLAAAGVGGYMAWRFVQPSAPLETPANIVLGPPDDFPEGRTFIKQAKVFIERAGSRLRCISAVCTHLGCLVKWDADKIVYQCPCHGASFSPDGQCLTGPASRPLPFARLSIDSDGRLVVHRKQAAPAGGAQWLDLT